MRISTILVTTAMMIFLDLHQVAAASANYDLKSALKSYNAGAYDKVVKELDGRVDQLDKKGLMILAESMSNTDNHVGALKTFTLIVGQNPKDPEPRAEIGFEQLALKRYPEALATLKEAIDLDPKYEKSYLYLAKYFEIKKNRYELQQVYEDMLKRFGEKVLYFEKLCEITAINGLHDLTFQYCKRGIELDPKVQSFYIFLGLAYKETGEVELAEKNLKKAADDYPKSEIGQMVYANLSDEKKNYSQAYSYYKKAFVLQKSEKAMMGIVTTSLELEKYEEALQNFPPVCRDKKLRITFRKAAANLRTVKRGALAKKYEDALEDCY